MPSSMPSIGDDGMHSPTTPLEIHPSSISVTFNVGSMSKYVGIAEGGANVALPVMYATLPPIPYSHGRVSDVSIRWIR